MAALKMHDNWLRMLQDDEPPKSSWRPRKSVKSWDQLSVQKINSHEKKAHHMGKMGPTGFVAWRTCTKIRDAPAEKRRESKEAQRELRGYFSSVSQRRIEREF